MQDPSEQRPHKLSYHLSAKGEDAQRVISQLGAALKAAGVRARIIYSGGMDVDILPEGASKGDGLKFLLRQVHAGAACICYRVDLCLSVQGRWVVAFPLTAHNAPDGQHHHARTRPQKAPCSLVVGRERRGKLTCQVGLQIKEAGNAPKDGVMVCGDSGNDVELFAVPGVRGCMVVNAHPELKQWCDAHASPDLFQVREIPLHILQGIIFTEWIH